MVTALMQREAYAVTLNTGQVKSVLISYASGGKRSRKDSAVCGAVGRSEFGYKSGIDPNTGK